MTGRGGLLLLVCLTLACQPAQQPPELVTEDQKALYALGFASAQSMQSYELTQDEARYFVRGFNEGVEGGKPLVDVQKYAKRIEALSQRRMAARSAEERQAAESFLVAEASQDGAVRSDSGLIYRELNPGAGESPSLDARVKVHYHGTLRDGRVFDSSVERGQAAQFPLRGVIACWTEALQRMKPGGKAVLVCPADIAYGNRGAGKLIMPGAALKFEVELIEIYEP